MDNQFNDILDNLNDDEVKVEEVKPEPTKKKRVRETPEEKAELKSIYRARLFWVLLAIAIVSLGVIIAQICLLCR